LKTGARASCPQRLREKRETAHKRRRQNQLDFISSVTVLASLERAGKMPALQFLEFYYKF